MPLGSDAFLRRHPADPTLTELCSPSQPLVLIVTTVRSPTYAQFSTAARAQAATPTGGTTSSGGVSSGVHQEAVRAGEIRRCLGATHIQVPRHLRVKQVCAGLLAHSVTSKYINSLATIAKTNSIRPCRFGRRCNGNHQPRGLPRTSRIISHATRSAACTSLRTTSRIRKSEPTR